MAGSCSLVFGVGPAMKTGHGAAATRRSGHRAREKTLEVRPTFRAYDDEIRGDVRGKLRDFACRLSASDVDTDGLTGKVVNRQRAILDFAA